MSLHKLPKTKVDKKPPHSKFQGPKLEVAGVLDTMENRPQMALLSLYTSNVVIILICYHFMSIGLDQAFILLSLAMANQFKFVSEHFILSQVSLHVCETELFCLPLSIHQPYCRHCRVH